MDKAVVERAVLALAAINSARNPEIRQAAVRGTTTPAATHVGRPKAEKLAACGSHECAGCYDVGEGRKIHPPKCGDDYQAWFAFAAMTLLSVRARNRGPCGPRIVRRIRSSIGWTVKAVATLRLAGQAAAPSP